MGRTNKNSYRGRQYRRLHFLPMTKESIIELQKIDCNCNDCKHMVRDFETFAKWEEWNRNIQENEFERKKAEAFRIANECQDEQGKKTLLFIANKMSFMFDHSGLISYGDCLKFGDQVTFIPNTCQLDTQACFEHRRS